MEEQQRERLTQPSTQSDDRGNPAEQTPTMWPPGLVAFAAVMMLALAGFHILLSISEFASNAWVLSRPDIELVIPTLIIWAVIDLAIALIALYAGISILGGGTFGWIVGYTFATLGIIRWLFYIPVSPVLGVVVIVLDMLVIYGLVKHSDYFQSG